MLAAMPRLASSPASDTATRALDVAETLVQQMGFNWFSYADIAEALGIRKASLHHHFPSKADLGRALLVRYRDRFDVELKRIHALPIDAHGKLLRYVGLYEAVLRGDRLCLCGMLAAEYASLPEPMQEEIRSFFDLNRKWLASVIREGRRSLLFHTRDTPESASFTLLGALEGAMLVARPYGDVARFAESAAQVLESLKTRPGSKGSR